MDVPHENQSRRGLILAYQVRACTGLGMAEKLMDEVFQHPVI